MIWLIVIGCVVCWFAFPLSDYIDRIESNEKCENCTQKQNCFARKKVNSSSNMVDYWMFFSYLVVRKKCQEAQCRFFIKCLVCVVVSFALAVIPFWSEGMSVNGLLYGISVTALFFLSVVDWNTQYIPFEMNGIIFICGLIHLFADFSNWVEYLIGLIAVSGFLCIVNWIATPVLRKRYEEEIDSVIGDGDIKLMAATGLLLGWKLNFLALGIGCVTGSVIHLVLMKIKGSGRQFALGPYLSLGVYITMICGKQLVSWYLNMMGVMPY